MSRTPKVVREWSRIKLISVGVLFALFWLALWFRAAHLQLVQGSELADKALRQHITREHEQGDRGHIWDRDGRLLAKSVEFTAVNARPSEVEDPEDTAQILGQVLNINPQDILKKLKSKENFVYLARRVIDKASVQIGEAELSGIYLSREFGRSYPNRHLLGQLLGFVGHDHEGLEGLEKSLDSILAGKKSSYIVQRDASGRKFYLDSKGRELTDLSGSDVRLTIDSQVQFFAEEALVGAVAQHNAKAGVCMVVHVPSAEILAWASYPLFNPNNYERRKGDQSFRNRPSLDALEPGSTMKPLVVAAALQEGLIKPSSEFFCENGRWKVGRFTIRDTHSYGKLTVNKIVRWSSNIGMAKIGQELGANRLHKYFVKMGFGKPTGLPLAGEAKGLLRPAKEWQQIGLATASFGQGVAITPLQLIQAYTALANDGVWRPLRLVLEPVEADLPEKQAVRLFDTQVARLTLEMMREAVEEEKGTGSRAKIEGIRVGGKTGTAQKASPKGGYSNKYVASFIFLLPVDKPEYAILMMVDEPEPSHYGGVVAAPAVKEVALRTLAYHGKLPEKNVLADSDKGTGPKESGAAKAPVLMTSYDIPLQSVSLGGGGTLTTKVSKFPQSMSTGKIEPAMITSGAGEGLEERIESIVNAPVLPNFVGQPLRLVVESLAKRGLVPTIKGRGIVVLAQDPPPGKAWPATEADTVTLWLSISDPAASKD